MSKDGKRYSITTVSMGPTVIDWSPDRGYRHADVVAVCMLPPCVLVNRLGLTEQLELLAVVGMLVLVL